MGDIAKGNKMKRTAKSQSKNAKTANLVDQEAANSKMKIKELPSQRSAIKSSVSGTAGDGGEDYNILTLKYEINERGVGKILLPPSLSTLLQSDRVSISPSAGGLFIRSI
jgi:hypothetical protein